MDCCNYGEYRGAQYGAGAAAPWEGYAGLYAPPPYAPYAHGYYTPHAHDPYARYYRYDYPAHHVHHNDHVMPMDYGVYASKEARVRRALARRDARAHAPVHHLPLPPTPPLECGMNSRGPAYCEPQMWSHYQVSAMGGNGWGGSGAVGASWQQRGQCARDAVRYPADCRQMKGPQMHAHSQMCPQDGRSTPYSKYEDTHYGGESVSARPTNTSEYPTTPKLEPSRHHRERERLYVEPRLSPPTEKRPPVVPLPAFQQAFGSTEIGKFAEAFSRTEVVLENVFTDNFEYEPGADWDPPEPQWSSQPVSREIKCEDNI